MPFVSLSAPCLSAACAAAVSFGAMPPGPGEKKLPPVVDTLAAVQSPDQSGNWLNDGIWRPPPGAAALSAAYNSDAARYLVPIASIRRNSSAVRVGRVPCAKAAVTVAIVSNPDKLRRTNLIAINPCEL